MKSLSIQEMLDDTSGGPIFVLNTSDRVTRAGDVFITINIGNSARPFKVPKTWIPMEVTRTLPRKNILESVHFMEALDKGLITAIPREDAAAIMKMRGYAEEVARLKAREDAAKAEGVAKGIGKNVTVTGSNGEEEEAQQPLKINSKNVSVVSLNDDDEAGDEPTVSASFVGWVNKINALPYDKAIVEIRVRGSMEQEEALYLVENSKHPKIVKSLSKKLGL